MTTAIERRRSESRQRTKFVGVRMLPSEYTAIAAAAAERGMSVPEFVRQQALWVARRESRSG